MSRDPDEAALLRQLRNIVGDARLSEVLETAVRDARAGRGRPQISPEALAEVREAYKRYQALVESSGLASNTKATYLLHGGNFTRWLAGDFTPGGRIGRP